MLLIGMVDRVLSDFGLSPGEEVGLGWMGGEERAKGPPSAETEDGKERCFQG